MAPQRTQNFNSIRLTTSNNVDNNIILSEVSGQLHVDDNPISLQNNIFSLKVVQNTEYTQESNYTHFLYDDDTAGGLMTITLLDPSSHQLLSQHKKMGSTGNILLSGSNGVTIDGFSSYTLDVQNEAIGLYTDGSNYFIQ
jgi:hypothetical protein